MAENLSVTSYQHQHGDANHHATTEESSFSSTTLQRYAKFGRTVIAIAVASVIVLAGASNYWKKNDISHHQVWPTLDVTEVEETPSSMVRPSIEEDSIVGEPNLWHYNKEAVSDGDNANRDKEHYDVIIVGGSLSGLSAALCLGRSMRNVLVIDAGHPANAEAKMAHNLLGLEQSPHHNQPSSMNDLHVHVSEGGIPPSHLHSIAKSNVAQYPTVALVSGLVTNITTVTNVDDTNSNVLYYPISINANLQNDNTIIHRQARKLLLATGMQDLLPPIPGLKECWGNTAIHCPYCDGYEFQNQRTALLNMTPKTAIIMASIISKFTNELTIIGKYTGGNSFTLEQLGQLERHGIQLFLNSSILELQHTDGVLESVHLDNGKIISMGVVYIRPPKKQASVIDAIIPPLPLNDRGYIQVDPVTQKTPKDPNTYACGDCTDSNRALSIAMGSGTRAAKMINYELSMEDWMRT